MNRESPGFSRGECQASVRLDVRRGEAIKNGTEIIGNQTRVKVAKNKVAPPFRTAQFNILYGKGISRAGEIVDIGVEYGIIQKSGAWFSMGERRLGQGRDAVKQYFQEHPEEANQVQAQIMETLHEKNADHPSQDLTTETEKEPDTLEGWEGLADIF